MDYRLATEADIPELAGMRWAFRAEAGEVPVESEVAFRARYAAFFRGGLSAGTWVYWVAVHGGELVAHMAVCVVPGVPRPSRPSDQWGYLTDCYTRPAYRDAGIGSALLARVRAWAEARDLELLLVWPSDESTPFYARAGFGHSKDLAILPLRAYDTPP